MSKVYTEQVVIKLTPELRQSLEVLASEERRPLASMARLLIERGLSIADRRKALKTRPR